MTKEENRIDARVGETLEALDFNAVKEDLQKEHGISNNEVFDVSLYLNSALASYYHISKDKMKEL